MAEPLGIEYRSEDWPHGLRCAECHRLLRGGDRYSERLDKFVDDVPLVTVLCVACALEPTAQDNEEEK